MSSADIEFTKHTDKNGAVYKGYWQGEDSIMKLLDGPIYDGEVRFPNGDYFKGKFHLNYAEIGGPTHLAEGCYDFADGSYIERAWIDTAGYYALLGVYRIHHLDRPDSIAMFHKNMRYGFELVLKKNHPYVIEWYENQKIQHEHELEVLDYKIDETSQKDCLTLTISLKDGEDEYLVVQKGGKYHLNNFDEPIYDPAISGSIHYPNGDIIEYNYCFFKNLKPYHGRLKKHCAATAEMRDEVWEEGELKEAKEWVRDTLFAKHLKLPQPMLENRVLYAYVWADNFIRYENCWWYEGDILNDRPEGKGILGYGSSARYKGEFHEGRCHGQGIFDDEKMNIHQKGTWINGAYQEPHAPASPITLHIRHESSSWGMTTKNERKSNEYDIIAKYGELDAPGFSTIELVRIEKNVITLKYEDTPYLVTPEQPLHLKCVVEGREWGDGCVYDGVDYYIDITWK